MSTTPAPRVPRGTRTGVGLVVALVVIALAVLVTTAALQVRWDRSRTALGDPDVVTRWLRDRDWTDTAVFAIGITLAAVGLLLILLAVLPARRRLIELSESHPGTTTGITRGALRRDLAAVAGGVDGIDNARARVGPWRVRVDAVSSLRNRSGLSEGVQAAVTDEMARLAPRRRRSVRTSVRGKAN